MNNPIVEGHSNLYRDLNSGAIVNSNFNDYENYMKQYKSRQYQSEKIDILESELNLLKSEMTELKQLFQKFI